MVYGFVLFSKTARSREGVQLPSKKNKEPCASCPRFLCDLKRTEQLGWSQDQDKDASGLRSSGERGVDAREHPWPILMCGC